LTSLQGQVALARLRERTGESGRHSDTESDGQPALQQARAVGRSGSADNALSLVNRGKAMLDGLLSDGHPNLWRW